MDIDFSSTDYAYIQECDTDKIATALIRLSNKDMQFYDGIETALFNLKAICQNKYNSDFYRQFLFILTEIADNNEE